MEKKAKVGPNLSLILPCYNESEHILESIKKIISVLEASKFSYEVILIDDKSKDNTVGLLKKIKKTARNIFVFFHEKNMGRGATVMDGIKKAKGEVVGFIDIDLEIDPNYLPLFVEAIETGEADVVIASRSYPYNYSLINHILRFILSKTYSRLIKYLLKLPVGDTESGYKFFNRKKILNVLPNIVDAHWFWDTEIVARSVIKKLKVKEIPVLFIRNPSKTSTVKVVSDTIAYIKALYRFKKSLRRKIV